MGSLDTIENVFLLSSQLRSLNISHTDHLKYPWDNSARRFRFPNASYEDQAESHTLDEDVLAHIPGEVQTGKVNNDRKQQVVKMEPAIP